MLPLSVANSCAMLAKCLGFFMGVSVEELALAYHGGWEALDPDAIAALHSADSVFHMHGTSEPITGPGAIRDYIQALIKLVPDLHFEIKRLYVGADHIALEYDMSGTYVQTHFVCDGADIIAVQDGLVTRKDTYLDLAALTSQVGVLPKIN
jgi:ketosteroid isomerase-like protein